MSTDRPRILPVILCGGAGTRLWPLSTEAEPKPFHALIGDESLFQQTLRRVAPAADERFLPPMIVCGRAHQALVEVQMAAIGSEPSALVLEPCGRGTAPIAAIAATLARERWPDALVLMVSTDHVIADAAAFRAAVAHGAVAAASHIVIFGVTPSRPETGYGYIRRGSPIADRVHEVSGFVEKPDLPTAEAYVAAGDYSWNAGVFLFSPALMLEELAAARPDIAEAALAALPTSREGGVIALDEARFAACPAESIDRAVMERTARAAVALCDFDWADVGAWNEVWRLADRDTDENAVRGDVLATEATGCLIASEGPTVIAIGVEDLVIVATATGVLVVPRARAQEIGALAQRIAARPAGSD